MSRCKKEIDEVIKISLCLFFVKKSAKIDSMLAIVDEEKGFWGSSDNNTSEETCKLYILWVTLEVWLAALIIWCG